MLAQVLIKKIAELMENFMFQHEGNFPFDTSLSQIVT